MNQMHKYASDQYPQILRRRHKNTPDWSQHVALEDETFASHTVYDALNRPIKMTTPDKSLIQPAYNEANLLDKLKVNPRGAETATPFVTNINYNAKEQRERIEYGNGTKTEYAYCYVARYFRGSVST